MGDGTRSPFSTWTITHWLNEVPLVTVPLATSNDGGTLILTALDVAHNSVPLRLRNDRSLIDSSVEGVTDDQLLRGLDEALDELVVDA